MYITEAASLRLPQWGCSTETASLGICYWEWINEVAILKSLLMLISRLFWGTYTNLKTPLEEPLLLNSHDWRLYGWIWHNCLIVPVSIVTDFAWGFFVTIHATVLLWQIFIKTGSHCRWDHVSHSSFLSENYLTEMHFPLPLLRKYFLNY